LVFEGVAAFAGRFSFWGYQVKAKGLTNEVAGDHGVKLISLYEHAVSVGIEAVTLGDGVFVGMQDVFFATESTDQHEQRGLWQVEISKHGVDNLEFEAGIDEEVGRRASSRDDSFALPNCVFESADGGRADGDHAALVAKCLIDGRRGGGGDGIGFGMKFMVFDAFDVDWLEGSQADMKSDLDGFYAALPYAIENF